MFSTLETKTDTAQVSVLVSRPKSRSALLPIHWQKKVKADEAIVVIKRVPTGTPITWCHKMVVVAKKDITSRRTVNFQPLNQNSSRQTHKTMSRFHQATSVPKNTMRKVIDIYMVIWQQVSHTM